MATKKFKKNLVSLSKMFKTTDELLDFLTKKKAFNEDFTKNITESDYLNKLNNFDHTLDINEIKRRLHYEIQYKNKRISVDITKNDVFSYLDTEEDLIKKMNYYIRIEDYEKAQMMQRYFKTIELDY